MSTSSSTRRAGFWRPDWFVALVIVLAVWGLRQPSDPIAVIAIDDQSVASIGRWPWPRNAHAQPIADGAARDEALLLNHPDKAVPSLVRVVALAPATARDFGRTVVQPAAAGTPPAPGYDAAPGASSGATARLPGTDGVGMPPSGVRPGGDRQRDLEP